MSKPTKLQQKLILTSPAPPPVSMNSLVIADLNSPCSGLQVYVPWSQGPESFIHWSIFYKDLHAPPPFWQCHFQKNTSSPYTFCKFLISSNHVIFKIQLKLFFCSKFPQQFGWLKIWHR